MNFFITGTNTDVGKTFVTAYLAALFTEKGCKVAVYKPFQTGSDIVDGVFSSPDLSFVKQVCADVHIESEYLMENPCAPEAASEVENVAISIEKVINKYKKLEKNFDIVLVEGAGGIAVPTTKNCLMSDLIKALDMPVLVVADSKLGTISNILTTLYFAKGLNINVLGLILNKYPFGSDELAMTSLETLINRYSDGVPILGKLKEVPQNRVLDKNYVLNEFKQSFNIDRLVNIN